MIKFKYEMNVHERSWNVNERLRMIMNDFERSRTFMNEMNLHEGL
jgi:hypothetical protein